MNKKNIRQIIVACISISLLLYVGMCILLFVYQKNLIFFPSKKMISPSTEINMESVYFKTKDGVSLHGWYRDHKAEKTILFFHGNAGNISTRKKRLELLHNLNANILIFDYRSYGKSTGEIKKESDLYADGTAALEYLLHTKKIPLEEIILWGNSLGGSIAIDIAQHKNVGGVIVESSFTSIADIASEKFWFIPLSYLLRFQFLSIEKIKNISSKILIIHSTEDEIIPFFHGEKLYNAANSPKEIITISGSHNSGFHESYPSILLAIKNFTEQE